MEGIPLVVVAVGYTVQLIRSARGENAPVLSGYAEEHPQHPSVRHRGRLIALQSVLLLVGLVMIVFGAHWLVDGAVGLATALGVSDAIIGLTIVAIGTSAPELATMIISTIRGNRDIAVGNLIGSSIYNLTLVLGIALLAAPRAVMIDPELVLVDLPIMAAVSLVCLPVMRSGRRMSRVEGAAFVAAYAVYLGYLLIART